MDGSPSASTRTREIIDTSNGFENGHVQELKLRNQTQTPNLIESNLTTDSTLLLTAKTLVQFVIYYCYNLLSFILSFFFMYQIRKIFNISIYVNANKILY